MIAGFWATIGGSGAKIGNSGIKIGARIRASEAKIGIFGQDFGL